MKAKLKRVPSKHKADVRSRIHKAGGIMFDELAAILSQGSTNIAVLDLNGEPTTVMADAVGIKAYRKRKKVTKLTRLERSIQRALESNDVEVDISTAQALALLARTYAKQENLLKKYGKSRG